MYMYRDDEQPGPSTETQSRRGRGCGRVNQSRSRSPQAQAIQPHQSSQPWQTAADPDTAPHTCGFVPEDVFFGSQPGES